MRPLTQCSARTWGRGHWLWQSAKEELQDILEFQRPSEGVAGPLRGAAAMKVLREVYGTLDHEGSGVISKAALMAALREDRKVRTMGRSWATHLRNGGITLLWCGSTGQEFFG